MTKNNSINFSQKDWNTETIFSPCLNFLQPLSFYFFFCIFPQFFPSHFLSYFTPVRFCLKLFCSSLLLSIFILFSSIPSLSMFFLCLSIPFLYIFFVFSSIPSFSIFILCLFIPFLYIFFVFSSILFLFVFYVYLFLASFQLESFTPLYLKLLILITISDYFFSCSFSILCFISFKNLFTCYHFSFLFHPIYSK